MDMVATGRSGQMPDSVLTPPSLIRLDYFAPPADLASHVITYFRIRSAEPVTRDVQPASAGQFYVYLSGEGRMNFADGRVEPGYAVTVMGPLNRAASYEVEGPLDVFGAALGPLGWAALTGRDAATHADRLFDAAAMLGPDAAVAGETIRALAHAGDGDGVAAGEAMAAALSTFLRARFRPLQAQHVALVGAVIEWLGSGLNPPVEDLYARTDYSPRQAQRLVARFFGVSPIHLARKYRATRVAALLGEPDIDDATVAALTDKFYDQPHMIREIREFIGRTPKRLGAGDAPILEAVVNVRNFVQISPEPADLAKAPPED